MSSQPRYLAADHPERIAQVLFNERDLGLQRELDVSEVRSRATIGCDPREDPRRSLLIHQPARPIDRIDDDSQLGVVLPRA